MPAPEAAASTGAGHASSSGSSSAAYTTCRPSVAADAVAARNGRQIVCSRARHVYSTDTVLLRDRRSEANGHFGRIGGSLVPIDSCLCTSEDVQHSTPLSRRALRACGREIRRSLHITGGAFCSGGSHTRLSVASRRTSQAASRPERPLANGPHITNTTLPHALSTSRRARAPVSWALSSES